MVRAAGGAPRAAQDARAQGGQASPNWVPRRGESFGESLFSENARGWEPLGKRVVESASTGKRKQQSRKMLKSEPQASKQAFDCACLGTCVVIRLISLLASEPPRDSESETFQVPRDLKRGITAMPEATMLMPPCPPSRRTMSTAGGRRRPTESSRLHDGTRGRSD